MRLALMALLLLMTGECRLTPHGLWIRIDTLADGALALRQTSGLAVARSPSALNDLWAEAGLNGPPPQVDFDSDMVIAYFMGGRPTGGYSTAVTGARREGDGLRIDVREIAPGDGCGVTQAPTSPVTIVRTPMRSGAVEIGRVMPQRRPCD